MRNGAIFFKDIGKSITVEIHAMGVISININHVGQQPLT